MAQSRQKLHNILRSLVGSGVKVYFQPPEGLKLEYPCVVYKRDFEDTQYGDNSPYRHHKRYMVTVIDPDPDSEIPSKIASLQYATFNRFYTAENLNHDVYNVFF